MKEKLLISACLLGKACRYDGKSKSVIDADSLHKITERYDIVPVCPECLGGLDTPRVPSERCGERVVMKDGNDVTAEFTLGATRCLELARDMDIRRALLKERSPSCGVHQIYDGSFTGRLIRGRGVLSQMLDECGVSVYSEDDIEQLIGT